MGCVGSTEAAAAPPAPGARGGGPGRVFENVFEKRVWAKGVGTAFEFLNEQYRWEPIVDPIVINELGKLCAYNATTVVTYDGRDNGQSYRTVQQADGMLSQTNIRTGVSRCIRLVPFFFEFEEGPFDWRPVTDPKALMALTAVLASSLPKQYKYKSATTHDEHEAEAKLVGEKGLLQQRNVATQKRRYDGHSQSMGGGASRDTCHRIHARDTCHRMHAVPCAMHASVPCVPPL